MRLLRVLAAALVGAGLLLGAAQAQDAAPSKEERVRRIRQLPPEDKRRLKTALDRFNALPAAEREALRRKAREVGADRLGELTGRDFPKLKERHARMQREVAEILNLLGAPERFVEFSTEEREFVRNEVARRFQEHCRMSLLQQASISPDFNGLTHEEMRARRKRATDAAIDRMLAEKAPTEQNRVRALPPLEQRRERAQLLLEWRMRETIPFVQKKFEPARLVKFIDMSHETRREHMRRSVRWFQLAGLLRADGVSPDALWTLSQLRPAERALVALAYEQARQLPPIDRRTRVEEKIRELYGAVSLDAERAKRPQPRLREILQRDRRAAPLDAPRPPR